MIIVVNALTASESTPFYVVKQSKPYIMFNVL